MATFHAMLFVLHLSPRYNKSNNFNTLPHNITAYSLWHVFRYIFHIVSVKNRTAFYPEKKNQYHQTSDPQELRRKAKGDSPMMLMTIRMLLPHKKRGDVLKILRSFAEQSRIQQACIHSRIYADLEEENVIMFEEMWRSSEDLERNTRSEEYRNLLLIVELALKCPEIKFNCISNSTGIETIEKVRSNV